MWFLSNFSTFTLWKISVLSEQSEKIVKLAYSLRYNILWVYGVHFLTRISIKRSHVMLYACACAFPAHFTHVYVRYICTVASCSARVISTDFAEQHEQRTKTLDDDWWQIILSFFTLPNWLFGITQVSNSHKLWFQTILFITECSSKSETAANEYNCFWVFGVSKIYFETVNKYHVNITSYKSENGEFHSSDVKLVFGYFIHLWYCLTSKQVIEINFCLLWERIEGEK